MRKRVILFCLFVVIGMLTLRSVIRIATHHPQIGWQPSYDDLTPPPTVAPPPWVTDTDPVGELPQAPTMGTIVVEEIRPEIVTDPVPEPELPPALPLEEDEDKVVGFTSDVVINEIMFYAKPNSDQEILGHEYVELFNPTDQPISLAGYHFSRGIDFTFPIISILPQSYVVLVPDETAFRAEYGDSAKTVVGSWQGRLSNSGEELRLENAAGELVDKVAFADQGDWATRIKTDDVGISKRAQWQGGRSYRGGSSAGWEWTCTADGEGSSLELVNPRLSNNRGSNWLPSRRDGGTPGRQNSVFSADIAPLISGVAHHPAVPKPDQQVVIIANIEDEAIESITAQVRWRVSQRRETNFASAPMQHTGKGRYVATLPGHGNGSIIEFYVEASDGKRARTWPAPTNSGQTSNAHYQVDSEVNRTVMGFYRLVMSVPEKENFDSLYVHSNAQMNTTLIADDGSGPIIRYQCGTRIRGAGSRNNTPRPMRVNIPRDRPWNDRYGMNLNSVYPWLQFIGMKLFQASDLPAPEMLAVQVRMNGENDSQRSDQDYGAFVHAQPLDGQFIKQYFPDDAGGNLYKKVRPDNSWSWRRGDIEDYQSDGWLKQSNAAAFEWDDLDVFLSVMNNASRQSDYLQQVDRVMDIDQWLRYFGVMALLNNNEGGIANGIDDDYAIYRGVKDTRFRVLPHDLDTILGVGESSSNPHHTLFDFVENGSRLEPLVRLFRHPEIRKRYFLQLANLLETSFAEKSFESLVDRNLSGWVAASTISRIKDFMALRRHYASQELRRQLGTTPPKLPPPTSASFLHQPASGLMIHEVLAANGTAYEHRGGYPDIIELHNPGSETVSLAGMSLTDDADKPGQFIFPDGAEISASGYLVVYADSQSVDDGFHLGFGLKQEGETLTLFSKPNAAGERKVLDSLAFGPQIPGFSIGRGGAELAGWALTQPSIGAANESVPLGNPNVIKINEWLAYPDARFTDDFVELANPSAVPVSLGDVSLTDDSLNAPKQMVFPPLSFIPSNGFLLLESQGKKSARRHPCDLTFRLASHHGWLTLFGANGSVIDKVHYWGQRPDISQGRLPDGSEGVGFLRMLSPGKPNGGEPQQQEGVEASGLQALIAGLRVSELMYHPQDPALEFIELTNIGEIALPLLGVRFTGGIECVLPDVALESGACVLLVGNREAFEGKHGADLPVAAEYQGKLSNGGEVLQLTVPRPGNLAIQRFEYDDAWYPSADGAGHSIEVIDLQANVQSWSELTQWRPSAQAGGSPGTR